MDETTDQPNLAAARGLAQLGYRVFPLRVGEKTPAITNGVNGASADLDQVDTWWVGNPDCNVGLSTEGLVVIDVDVVNGQENPWLTPERREEMQAAAGAVARTPRGGWHFFFRPREGQAYRNTAGKIAPHVDTRTDGGYVVVAPSQLAAQEQYPGGAYTWEKPLKMGPSELPEAPDWVTPTLPVRRAAVERVAVRRKTRPSPKIGEGTRNIRLASLAGKYLRSGIAPELLEPFLGVANQEICNPPLDDAEVKKIVTSISRYRTAGDESQMQLLCINDVLAEKIEWLWPGRLAMGKMTLLCGDPGLGKSTLTTDIAARTSTGAKWPDGGEATEAGSVILFSAEDGIADTIKPRLEAAGADLTKIHAFDCVKEQITKNGQVRRRGFNLETDLPRLTDVITKIGDVKLVIIDPITSFIGRVDSHKNSEVRNLLEPVARMAQEHKLAVLAITHLSKGTGATKAIYRAIGSLAFAAVSRLVFLLAADLRDPEKRLLLPIKANITARQPGLGFRITSAGEDAPPKIDWENEGIDITADQYFEQVLNSPKIKSAVATAVSFLSEKLSGGPILSTELEEAVQSQGISDATYRRARQQLGIRRQKRRDKWYSSLPTISSIEEQSLEPSQTNETIDVQ